MKSNGLRVLDSNFDYRIKSSLYTAVRKQKLPMKFATLENKNKSLYEVLTKKMQNPKQGFRIPKFGIRDTK